MVGGGDPFYLNSCVGGLWATYDDHLKLIVKRVVDILLVLIELFSQRKRNARFFQNAKYPKFEQ